MRTMRCNECDHGFQCCHSPSVRHADGTTECLADGPCDLAHDLHTWVLACDEAGCTCLLEETWALPMAA
jgi:hypothetical protein